MNKEFCYYYYYYYYYHLFYLIVGSIILVDLSQQSLHYNKLCIEIGNVSMRENWVMTSVYAQLTARTDW